MVNKLLRENILPAEPLEVIDSLNLEETPPTSENWKFENKSLRKPSKLLCGNDSSRFFQAECIQNFWFWTNWDQFKAILTFFNDFQKMYSNFFEFSCPWAPPSLSQGSLDLRQSPCIHRNPYRKFEKFCAKNSQKVAQGSSLSSRTNATIVFWMNGSRLPNRVPK